MNWFPSAHTLGGTEKNLQKRAKFRSLHSWPKQVATWPGAHYIQPVIVMDTGWGWHCPGYVLCSGHRWCMSDLVPGTSRREHLLECPPAAASLRPTTSPGHCITWVRMETVIQRRFPSSSLEAERTRAMLLRCSGSAQLPLVRRQQLPLQSHEAQYHSL